MKQNELSRRLAYAGILECIDALEDLYAKADDCLSGSPIDRDLGWRLWDKAVSTKCDFHNALNQIRLQLLKD